MTNNLYKALIEIGLERYLKNRSGNAGIFEEKCQRDKEDNKEEKQLLLTWMGAHNDLL